VFIGEGKPAVVFALFIAAALSISSLPVIAKILSELGMTRRNFGQLTLAAGMANDVIGWLILGVIASMARQGRSTLVTWRWQSSGWWCFSGWP
jgi:Kef-type K+ transport system membrane component KefB